MAWRRPGDKPFSEPMMVSLLTHICVTRPQWVRWSRGCLGNPTCLFFTSLYKMGRNAINTRNRYQACHYFTCLNTQCWYLNTNKMVCVDITRQIWGIWKLRPAYSPETPNLGQNRWCFVPCDLEIWWMTLENNRASLLCCFKLCATFHSHPWIQTGVTVRKRPIWVKLDDF